MVHAFSDLRVVLMSATVDTSLFAEYFGFANIVEVYGRVHPVQRKSYGQIHKIIEYIQTIILIYLMGDNIDYRLVKTLIHSMNGWKKYK